MSGVDWLWRASLFAAGVLIPALAIARLVLPRQAALRHALLLGALLLAGLAPLWLALGSRLGPARLPNSDAQGTVDQPLLWLPPGLTAGATEARPPSGDWLPAVLLLLWAGGAAVSLLRMGRAYRRIGGLLRRARRHQLLPDVWLSDEVSAAVVVGLRRPSILLAPDLAGDARLLAQVLAHERAHARRRDPLWGLLQRLLTALYWFHPVVHLASREIARAREEACDDEALARHPAPDYARTLLTLATRAPAGLAALPMQPAAGELERRIRRLLEPRPPARRRPARALLAGALVIAGGARLAMALAPSVPGPTGPLTERAASPDERAAFALAGPGAVGSFVLRELDSGHTVVINPELARQRLTPASTFKIVVALCALETGVVGGADHLLPWDGRRSEISAWDRDHTLASAMRTSANWYFLELLRRIDRRRLQDTLARLSYGNQNLGAEPLRAFMNGDLAISALEQVEVLSRLATGALSIRPATRQALKQATHILSTGDAEVHGKTGTAVGPRTGTISWLVGHVRRGNRQFAFALLLRAPETEMDRLRTQRLPVATALLARLGALPEAALP